MPNKHRILCALLALFGVSTGQLAAAPDAPPSWRYAIKSWGHDEGLPQSWVGALTQTRDGYLWLGTLDGLVRFDGIHFTSFDQSTTPGLKSGRIVYLFEDSRENLWIGTETAGVALAQTNGQIIGLKMGGGGREGRLVSASEDSSGTVWLNTADGEVARYQGGKLGSLSARAAPVIAEKSGPLWLATGQGLIGLSTISTSALYIVQQELPFHKLDYLMAGKRGGFWFLADGHIRKWEGQRPIVDWLYPWSASTPVTAACEDLQGNLAVGTYGDGIYWFDSSGKATHLTSEQGLSHSFIMSLCMDREGSLWVGTDGGGLNRVKRQAFDVLEESRRFTVQSVCDDHRGGLWIGYYGKPARVEHWNEGVLQTYGPSEGLGDSIVTCVFADRDQRLWAGTYSGLFQLEQGRFRRTTCDVIGSNSVISALFQDRRGRFWVGAQNGLAEWDGRIWSSFTTARGLSSDEITAIAETADGAVWVGTRGGGLDRFEGDKFTPFRKEAGAGPPDDDISSLLADKDGTLWIGTPGGLGRLEKGQWTRFTTRHGLVSNNIGYMIEDDQGNLWIGSNAGLMRVSKQGLRNCAAGLTNVAPCRVYTSPYDLPMREAECTFGSQPAALRGANGRLWFPTTKGLAFVDPDRLKPNSNPPPVVIESVLIEDQEQNTNGLRGLPPQAITIPAGKERLEIHYTSLNLAAPDRARFRYRLEGHETGWNDDVGNARVARYSNLGQGPYRFHVIACNEDNVWNIQGGLLAIKVLPPFWRTGWFVTLMSLSLLAMIIGLVHYVSTQKLQRQLETYRQQQAVEKERARIARDIHDHLGASLTQVSLLGEMVESDKNAPDEIEAHGRQISQTARDATRELDEIVWTVNPSNDTLDGLITYICKYAQDYLAVAGLRYRLDVPAQLPATALPPETRHNVFLSAREAVTNIVRHAKATEVHIRLELDRDRFVLEIEDNGRGMGDGDPQAARTRNGLRNMRKRMEEIGGAFAISPGAGGGARVRLTAPIDAA